MENIQEGLEVDTKHMIQAKKAFKFFLPNPDNTSTRESDSDFPEKLKEINTLSLIDYDKLYGTLYFGK
jgi:hypothetical protein